MGEHLVTFEGAPMPARAGESLAAALIAHGVRVFRTTREGRARGMFCGMGVCQECVLEVDGQPDQRACMVKVDRPMRVSRGAPCSPLPAVVRPLSRVAGEETRSETPEVLVIGAGPGGLAAAIAARQAGATVLVLDERSGPGGQYFKQVATAGPGIAGPDPQHRAGARLIETAVGLGVEIRSSCLVWGAFAPRVFMATDRHGTTRFEPRAAIVATGAYERGWPVPGWTLPGVMTTGAAQTLWRTARRLPGQRILVAGNGPLNLQLAAELLGGGAIVVAVVEAAVRPGARQLPALLAMAAASPGLLRNGWRDDATRRRAGTPLIHGRVIAGIEQLPGGLHVRLATPDGTADPRSLEADVVCLGYGFEPSNELLRALGCGHDFDTARRQLATRRDADGQTDVPGIYALGDCTGLGGAMAAQAEGTLTGTAVARALGHAATPAQAQGRRQAERALARHRRFQRALWQLFAAPAYDEALATPDTQICRCEEVTFSDLEAALAEGFASTGAIKRRTRIGMGPCQGRYCAPVLDAALARRGLRPRGELSGFAPRVPFKPVAIADLVETER